MESKIVVGTKDGKSYNLEVKDDQAAVFVGKHIGDTINVTPLGLKGYEVKITGGSDKQGFPMRKDAHVAGRTKALVSGRTQGYKPDKAGIRMRKTVVGDIIGDNISQINTVVVKQGKDSIEKLLGLEKPEEAPAEGEASKEAPKEGGKEEKPEKPKEPKEEPKKEKAEAPKEEAKPAASEEKGKKE